MWIKHVSLIWFEANNRSYIVLPDETNLEEEKTATVVDILSRPMEIIVSQELLSSVSREFLVCWHRSETASLSCHLNICQIKHNL